MLGGAREQHAVTLSTHPRPGAQPQDEFVLDAVVAERAVAVRSADLGLVLPARLAGAVQLKTRVGTGGELAGGSAHHARGDLGGVLQEAAEVANRAQLHANPRRLASPRLDAIRRRSSSVKKKQPASSSADSSRVNRP
jgi:hypothetical protein